MKLHKLNHIKKICLFIMKAISQNRQFPIHWKQFSARTFTSVLTRLEIPSKREMDSSPLKLPRQILQSTKVPRGISVLPPRVPLHSPTPATLHFHCFPTVPNAGANPSSFQSATATQRLERFFWGGSNSSSSSPINVTAKSHPHACWKLHKPVP